MVVLRGRAFTNGSMHVFVEGDSDDSRGSEVVEILPANEGADFLEVSHFGPGDSERWVGEAKEAGHFERKPFSADLDGDAAIVVDHPSEDKALPLEWGS